MPVQLLWLEPTETETSSAPKALYRCGSHVCPMRPTNPTDFAIFGWIETLLPDFVLAFGFFTALVYAVLGKRFEHQRSAVAASAALGLALSIGLVWWEQDSGLSIRDLGPFAVGFAVILLGGVMFQAIRQVGGSWAGAGIGLAASLLVAWILGARWPVAEQIVQTVITMALLIGTLAFLIHRGTVGVAIAHRGAKSWTAPRGAPLTRREADDLHEDHMISDLLGRRMRGLQQRTDRLREHPEEAGDALVQIQRMLPAEGWLTQRMAVLREKAVHVRQGHIARIEAIQKVMKSLSPEEKKKAAQELVTSYKEVKLDIRLERLDAAVAANEKKVRELTQRAADYERAHDYRRLHGVLGAAIKLEKHNAAIFTAIDRTEARLDALASKIAASHARGEP